MKEKKQDVLLDGLMKELKKRGADDIVLSLNTENRQQVKFFNNSITDVKSWQSNDVGLFLSKEQRVFVSSVKDLSEKNMGKIAENAIRFASVLGKNREYMGIAQGPFRYREVEDGHDRKVAGLEGGAIDLVSQAIDSALHDGASRCAGVFESGELTTTVLTSNRVKGTEKGTEAYFSMRVFTDKTRQARSLHVENAAGPGHAAVHCAGLQPRCRIEESAAIRRRKV